MAKPRTDRRQRTIEIGFEPRRGSREALGCAYERLLPSLGRPRSASVVERDRR
jgi:hypothetical protein